MSKAPQIRIDPNVKAIVGLLGVGTFLAASIVFPGLPIVAKTIMDEHKDWKREKQFKEWNRFNLGRLRQILKRLREQKDVKVTEKDGEQIVILTKRGKTKYLKYRLEEMIINKPPRWDGKWRLIIYDISILRRNQQELFRQTLKKLEFLKLQNSVYLYPYPCYDEVEFLRQYYDIGEEVIILEVAHLENEGAYKKYFNI